MGLTSNIKDGDWVSVRQATAKLGSQKLGPKSSPVFGGLTLNGTLNMNSTLDMNDNPVTDVGYIDFNLINGVSPAEGRMVWNDDDGTVNLGLKGGVVNLQVGQEQVARGKNTTGAQIDDGACVRISGASGSNPTFGLSDANDPTNAEVIGVATEDIANNGNGYATTFGHVRDIDTTGTDQGETWAAGDRLYVSNTAGDLTDTPPTVTERVIFVGIVLRAHATEGVLFVRPIEIPYLPELSGVAITDATERDIVWYDSSTGVWVNKPHANLFDAFNGTFLETIDFTISESAGTITGSLEQDGGGDLTQVFSDGFTTLDTTPALTIDLTAYVGTNAIPKVVFVYILQSAKTVMAASNSDWPATEHIKVANLVLKSAATTGTDGGALSNRNWNDHTKGTNDQGHITHIEERIRQLHARWKSGAALTLKDQTGGTMSTTDSGTAIELVVAEGTVYQLHKQTFPAFDMYTVAADVANIVNQVSDEGGNYSTTSDLVTDITRYVDGTAAGGAIGVNKYFNLVIWGVQNRSGEQSFVMINLPTGDYTTSTAAVADTNGTSVFDIPQAFDGNGFLIARLTFRLIAGSQWTYIAIEDLRGQEPGISAGVGVSTTDHGLLSGLVDDDHTQYLLADGTRALADAWDMGSNAVTNANIDTGDIAVAVVNTEWDAAYTHVSSNGTDHSDVVLNNTHRGSDGSDHTYINQDVTTAASPTFTGLSVTSSTTLQPSVRITNTNADALGPSLSFVKDSSSVLDDDELGQLRWIGDDSVGTEIVYVYIDGSSSDVTTTDTGGKLTFFVKQDSLPRDILILNGYNGAVGQGEVIINNGEQDVDFRVASSGNANAFLVDGSSGNLSFGTVATGTWEATDVGILYGGTGQSTAQAAIDALSAVSGATNEHVLTKDTGTGNAIWKVAAGGNDEKVKIDAAATAGYLGAAAGDGVLRTSTGIGYADGGDFVTLSQDINALTAESGVDTAADYAMVYDTSAAAHRKVLTKNLGPFLPETTRTINFTTADSAADIQAKIDAVGKYIPQGVTVTFQFADGTYILNDGVQFTGFFGGGTILIQGNRGEANPNDLHTTQEVYLDFNTAGSPAGCIWFQSCGVYIKVLNFKIRKDNSAGTDAIIYCTDCTRSLFLAYNYIFGDDSPTGCDGINVSWCLAVRCQENYISSVYYGLKSQGSLIFSEYNDDTGTLPVYGMRAFQGGVVAKEGTQPAGSTANETTDTGGVIR